MILIHSFFFSFSNSESDRLEWVPEKGKVLHQFQVYLFILVVDELHAIFHTNKQCI